MLQCCHKLLHLCVINTNFATSVWKQAHIAYRPLGLADVVNDCESRVDDVSSGLLDMRTVAWSDADKNYVFGAINPTYLAKMMIYRADYRIRLT
jgi:hypothetical protein